jgi:hypothetical protein
MMRLLIIISLFAISLFAADGELSLYVMKDGKPLPKQTVAIYKMGPSVNETANIGSVPKAAQFTTDEDGYLDTALPTGSYQLQLIAMDKGVAQAFVKKNFVIVSAKQTQIILSLKTDNTLAFDDMEAPKALGGAAAKDQNVSRQTGALALTILSSEDGKPVKGARIFVAGMKINAVSNKEGQVLLNLPEGNQSISVIQTSYSSQNVKVSILPKEMQTRTVELSPASMELEEFVVLAPQVAGSVASVIAKERDSDAVGNVLGAEQFKKSGDSNAASALRRVSGLTIVGGKYVYIRGLGERYSTILFNDLNIPSPNPTKRVVPLDLFPTSAIQDIVVQKTYTADLPANFGGGAILINSVDIPDEGEGFVKAAFRVKTNQGTGKKVLADPSPGAQIPSNVLAATDNNQNINTQNPAYIEPMLNYRGYGPKETTLPPGYKLSLSGAKSFDVGSGWQIGGTASAYYQNDNDYDNINFDQYDVSVSGGQRPAKQVQSDVTTFNEKYGGIFSIGANYQDEQKIKYTFFSTNQNLNISSLNYTVYQGSDPDKQQTRYETFESDIKMHQLSGDNHLQFGSGTGGYFDDMEITWAAEKSQANQLQPGSPEYTYYYSENGYWMLDKNSIWYQYSKLQDDVTNYRGDFKLPFTFNKRTNFTKFGVFVYNKERTFDSRLFRMLIDSNETNPILQQPIDEILSPANMDMMTLQQNSLYYDSYEASQKVNAYYVSQLLSVMEDLDILVSARHESSTQQLSYSQPGSPVYQPLKTDDWFPGLGLTYRMNKDMQLRLAYSQTITRPDFREFSANRYIDPITGNTVLGYEDLQPTYITAYDMKYEWYMNPGELLSFALFGKEFTDPIETVQKLDTNSADGAQIVSYRNAQSATSYGAEFDLRKRFAFLGKGWENMLFVTNLAYIQSNVVLSSESERSDAPQFIPYLTTTDRPMMGQSPYVVNLTWGYDSVETGNSALLLFNQIGERLVSLGTYGNPDQYQQPFAKLDFVTRWRFNASEQGNSGLDYGIEFKATNLLDSQMEITQGGKPTYYFKPGRAYDLTLSIQY